MNASAHLALRAALHTLLAADAALMDASVVQGRRRAMSSGVQRQVNVDLVDAKGTPDTTATQAWETRVFVECAARASADADAETHADALLTAALDAALAPGALAAAGVIDINVVGLQWFADDNDTQVAGARAALIVQHRTAGTSIAAA